MMNKVQEVLAAEEKIDRSAERIASLQADTADYQREVFTLIEQVYLYLNCLSEKYGDQGLEIVETVHSCLKRYNPQKGSFQHYFMVALKQRTAVEDNSAVAQQRGGIVLSRQDQRRIKAIIAIAHKKRCSLDAEQLPMIAAELLQEPQEEIRRLLAVNSLAVVKSEDDERLKSIPSEQQLENEVLDCLWIKGFIQKINRTYQGCRQTQKIVVSKLLTAKILAELPNLVNEQSLWQYEFWDSEIYNNYLSVGSIPSARQISADLGRNEASISRTFNNFLQKVNINRKEELL